MSTHHNESKSLWVNPQTIALEPIIVYLLSPQFMTTPEAFVELTKSRHSVRSFKPDPIPDSVLTAIVETSEMTPSWCNHQPWNVIIATGESLNKIRSEYVKLAADKVEPKGDVPQLHRTDVTPFSQKCMTDLFATVGKAEFAAEFGTCQAPIFNAPAVVYLTLPKGFSVYSAYDIGAFSMTLMLAARSHGIDSIPAAACVLYTDVLHRVLEVPEDQQFVVGIALGYASDSPINKFVPQRAPVKDVLTIKH